MANPLKSQLRKSLRRLIRESDCDSTSACEALATWLVAHPNLRTIATYSPLRGEVDLSPIALRFPDVRWVYPRVQDQHLTFHLGGDWVAGAFGIQEPADHVPEVSLSEIDAFICPGLAFDPSGHRLGRGRGFYDRMLALARPDALKVGICFSLQRVADTFPEPHDIPMHEVLS